MPIHDWPQVTAGIFHDYHHEWISTIKRYLNSGLLPGNYYALAEQYVGGLGRDVLTLEGGDLTQGFHETEDPEEDPEPGGLAVLTAPPKVSYTLEAEKDFFIHRKSHIAIRHTSDHKPVAVIEILSPGNKASQYAIDQFLRKSYDLITAGVHLLILDLFPPTPRDPNGIHAAIWTGFDDTPFQPPQDKPLTLAAYAAGMMTTAYVEPLAVGDPLIDMPVFLQPDIYVPLPLEETYNAAFEGVPKIWRRALAAPETQ